MPRLSADVEPPGRRPPSLPGTLRRVRFAVALPLLLAACGDAASTPASDAAAPTDLASTPDVSTDVPVPQGLQLRPHAMNIGDREAAAEVQRYVLGTSPELYISAGRFDERFADEYDFVYIFSVEPVTAQRMDALERWGGKSHPFQGLTGPLDP